MPLFGEYSVLYHRCRICVTELKILIVHTIDVSHVLISLYIAIAIPYILIIHSEKLTHFFVDCLCNCESFLVNFVCEYYESL